MTPEPAEIPEHDHRAADAPPRPHRPDPGTRVLFRWRKWDGGPHWEHDCVYLGSDQWGDWLGQEIGWRSERPGRSMPATTPNVTLVPPSGEWVYTANAAPHHTRIYIDLAWDAKWSDTESTVVEGIDMDLDVVDRESEGIYIEDRDEWDEHRVAYGYPLEIVDRLEQVAVDLERRVLAGEAPFDPETSATWLARLAALGLR